MSGPSLNERIADMKRDINNMYACHNEDSPNADDAIRWLGDVLDLISELAARVEALEAARGSP